MLKENKIKNASLQLIADKYLATVLASNFILPLLLWSVLWYSGHNESMLFYWATAGFLIGIVRGIHGRWLLANTNSRHPIRREQGLMLLAIISGLYWSLPMILFVSPDQPAQSLLVIATVLGVITGAVGAYAPNLKLIAIFTSCVWIPVCVVYLLHGTYFYYQLIALGTVFVALHSSYAANHKRAVLEALKLRYENIELMSQLKHQTAIAEGANRAKSRFLAAASHDLRQPLHAMGLFADSLHQKLDAGEPRKILNMLRGSLEALRTLFDSLLDISRLDAGVIEPRPRKINVKTLLGPLLDEYQAQAQKKGLKFSFRLQDAWVISDPQLLEDMIRNLVWNAIKYTDTGGILIGLRTRNQQFRFEVWDTGSGIPESEQRKIFEEFHQIGNRDQDRSQGIGLGLSIVQRLSQLLGHPVDVHSRDAKGSVFTILMDSVSPPAPTPSPRLRSAQDQDLRGVHILVVDDDADIRAALGFILKGWGCEVRSAEALDEAIAALDEFSPDLIIADYRLPGSATGDQVVQHIREEMGVDTPALIVTGTAGTDFGTERDRRHLDVLFKPVNPEELKRKLVAILNFSR